jgi:phosphatidylethanolamine/phosphatidyl-N-methylethanolamine N-methyltransferase
MLRKAHERVAEHKLAHVEALAVMDAQHRGFPDAFFDAVVAQYVITTVPDPEAALDRRAARSSSSTISAPRRGRGASSSRALRPWRGDSAGGRNSVGSGWRDGPSVTAACACSNAARCRRSDIFR